MKLLTENEIKFIKDTGVTPTVIQCGNREWYRTIFCDEIDQDQLTGDFTNSDEVFAHACVYAKQMYDVDLPALYHKCMLDIDGISVDYEAPYIIYTLLTEEELDKMTDKQLIEWLRDWKYFYGWRKHEEWDARIAREEAKGLYNGAREIRTWDDGTIYVSAAEED